MQRIALGAIRLYQITVSSFMRGSCRHLPSCSEYTHDAITKYGAARGLWLAVRRLGRCRPLGASGYDPVP